MNPKLLALESRLAAELSKRKAAKTPGAWCPHAPTPKQKEFLGLTCLEALYGGAAGGGKSDALLMDALQYVHVPGYSALILRRTYADLALPGAIMDRARDWLIPKGVDWNDKDKRFTFPPSGATLSFGYLDSDRDRFRYQGAELQYIAFDELTQFPEQWYRYLLSRLRRVKGLDVPIRARAASNPGGIGHDWVKRRFVDDASGERVFVPAKLDDNPHLDRDEYAKSLAQLDATTRRQLLEGIWVRDSGGLVYQFDETRNVIDEAPKLAHHIIGIDYGVTDATAWTVVGWRENDPTVYVVESYKREGLTPSEAAIETRALAETYKPVQIVGDVGGLGKAFAEEARRRFSLPIEPAEKQNKRGYQALFNGDLESGRIRVVRSKCEQLVKEWCELPWTEDRTKEAEGFDNHCSDSGLYSWRACVAYPERELEPPKPHGTREWAIAEGERLERLAAERLEEEARDRELNQAWWEQ